MLDKEEWIEHVNTHKAIVSAELLKSTKCNQIKAGESIAQKRFIEYADSWKTG